jgi:saccharopine dehydrogenase (NAD+, L-lysine-forming)
MKVLLVGSGGVGEAIALITEKRDPEAQWLKQMVLADYNINRAREVSQKLVDSTRFPPEQIDAGDRDSIRRLVSKYTPDLIMNGCDPRFNKTLFDVAYETGCNYMDMAMSLSEPHPDFPFSKCNIKLGDYQLDRHERWEQKGLLAVVGSGVEPGMSDVFARYAEKHFFDEIEEIGIRDGNNFEIEGYDIAFGFSIWTTIEECLNPPVIWEKERGWFTTEPFSEPEIFTLPHGIGNVEMVNVEHEEVLLAPRYINKGLRRVTFKFGLGDDFVQALKYLQALNLDSKHIKVDVGNDTITPRDFLAKVAPDPAKIGHLMTGKTCAGTWVKGKKNGMERQIYLYQVADNQECMEKIGSQAVVAQTAFNPVIMMELLAKGTWAAKGVLGPEAFDPDPFVALMEKYDFPGGLLEMDSDYKRKLEHDGLKQPIEQS